MGVNWDFSVKFDLEGQGQSLPKATAMQYHQVDGNLVKCV